MGCRPWVQIWPKYYHCIYCAVCTIISYIATTYQESIVTIRAARMAEHIDVIWLQHIREHITYYNTHQCFSGFEGVWYRGENQAALVFENYFSVRLKWGPEAKFVCFIFINKNITANQFTISTTDSPSSTRLQLVKWFFHVQQFPIVNTATSSESQDFSIHLLLDCLYSSVYRLTSTETSKPALLAIYERNAPVDSRKKDKVTRKMFPRHNVIIVTLCNHGISLTTNTTHGRSLPSQPSIMFKICIYGWSYRYMYSKCCRKPIKLCKCHWLHILNWSAMYPIARRLLKAILS